MSPEPKLASYSVINTMIYRVVYGLYTDNGKKVETTIYGLGSRGLGFRHARRTADMGFRVQGFRFRGLWG